MSAEPHERTWDGHLGSCPVGGAPISWGACEVPGWGPMPHTATVLADMASLGLLGTELGAPGFLPRDPAALRAMLDRFDLRFIGSFQPLVLHEPDPTPTLDAVGRVAELLASAGGEVLVGAVVQDLDWSAPRPLDDAGWRRLAQNASRAAELAAAHGIAFALHPHVGTLILHADDVERALQSTDVGWCLDTGHLMIGGVDPAAFAARHGDRITHVHLKDVDPALAAQVRAGKMSLLDATRRGLFTALGTGGAHVAQTLRALSDHGYAGWLVLEQDTTIAEHAPAGDGQPLRDARESIRFLQSAHMREES